MKKLVQSNPVKNNSVQGDSVQSNLGPSNLVPSNLVQSNFRSRSGSGWGQGWSLVTASVLTLGLASCTGSAPSASNSPSAAVETTPNAAAVNVVTTFLPITQFTKAVAGDRAQVTQLLPTNVGPHDFQAKPEDAQRLSKADVLVQNGLEMEEFLGNLVKNAENPKLKVIDTSQGIQPIATAAVEGQNAKESDHDHAHEHDHAHGSEKKGEKATAHGHSHGEYNPHIWLDPKRAIRQVENIRDGLSAADPGGKATYTANAAAYIAKLKTLDNEISTALKPYAGKTFVVFHDFAPYFAESYGLQAQFLVDVPEENPSPEDVKRLVKTVKASNLQTLLSEPQAAENTFAALAGDLKIKVSPFDPLESGGAEAVEPDYYLNTMRKNLESLKSAFGQSTQVFRPFKPLPMTALMSPVLISPLKLQF